MIKELVWVGISLLQPAAQRDSIGVETVNGKVFVIHKVSEKETLYAISRRYGTTVDAIVQYNPTAKTSLDVGQILKVPYTTPAKKSTPAAATGGGGIIHVVTAGETIFSIAKAYSVSPEDIKQWNNLGDNSISVGKELVIKRRGTAATTAPSTPTSPAPASRKGTHTVAAKETMFSIARQYNISVDQLKQWNNLTTTSLDIGQVLIVASPERGTTTPARQDNPATIAKTTPTSPVTRAPEPQTQQKTTPPATVTPPVSTPPASTTPVATKEPATQTIRISESTKNSDEVLESGMAELIEGTEGNRKYLALHRTAPVGTILKIKNEMNNREVFVRVMGKLPEGAAADSKVVIRISKSAYDRLGAIDPRFRVQVTYYK